MKKFGDVYFIEDENGYEAAAEVVATSILKQSNITDIVEYQPCILSEKTGCIAKSIGGIMSLSDLYNQHSDKSFEDATRLMYTENKIRYMALTTGLGEQLAQLLEFDALILNNTRKLDNTMITYKDGKYSIVIGYNNSSGFLSDTKKYPLTKNVRSAIQQVQPSLFNRDFSKQVKAVRSVCGSQLKINKNVSIEDALESLKQLYSADVLNRIRSVWNIQKERYSELFV